MALQDQLGKMVGPMPLGAWLAVVGGGLGFALYMRNKDATADPTAQAYDDISTDPGVGLGGTPAGYSDVDPTDDTTTGGVTTYADNDAWSYAAVQALIARGYPATTSTSAISKFLGGGSPNTQEWALINIAENLIGPPPSIPTISTPPTIPTGGGSTTSSSFKGVSQSTKGIPGPLGVYLTKGAISYYDIHGKAVGKRPRNYEVRIYQWGKIGSAWYGKSTTYYYRRDDLVVKPSIGTAISASSSSAKHTATKGQKPKATPKPKAKSYTVKRGDTLGAIAQHFHVTTGRLYSANRKKIGNNPNLIHPGLVLTIPAT